MPMTAKIKNNITMSSATYGSAYITKTYQFGAYNTEKNLKKTRFTIYSRLVFSYYINMKTVFNFTE